MPKNVFQILDDLAGGITELRAALAPFAEATGGGPSPSKTVRRKRAGRPGRKATAPAAKTASKAKTKKKSSKPRTPAQQLHARLIGALAGLSAANRKAANKIAKKDGKEQAIRFALAKKKAA